MMPKFTYLRPSSLKSAIAAISALGSKIHAGGTDLLGCLRDGVFDVAQLVSLSDLSELRGIMTRSDGGVRIGALTTLSEIASSRLLNDRYAALAQGAASAASPQLRNQGTIGGNICQRPRCWYYRGDFHCLRKGGEKCFAYEGENEYHCIFGGNGCYIVHPSDTAPALVALNARVHVVGPRGARAIPLDHFFVLPAQDYTRETVLQTGEIVTEIILPPSSPAMRSSYSKMRARGSWDFGLAGVALALTMSESRVKSARVALSGVAPIPWRSPLTERALIGQQLNAVTAVKAAAAAIEGAEPLSQNGYKVQLVHGMVEEAVLGLA